MLASEILRLVFGFVAVLGMIGFCAFAAKKAGLASMTGAAGGKRRLGLTEMLPLDGRRRLAIVKCDDKEYLILMGVAGETLIDASLDGPSVSDASETAIPINAFGGLGSGLGEIAAKLRASHKQSQNRAA